MSEQELLKENKQLKERVEFLEKALGKGRSENAIAYAEVRTLIAQKIEKEVPMDTLENGEKKEWTRKRAQRQCMDDLKWDLRIRNIADFKTEHIEQVKKYLETYQVNNKYKTNLY